VKYQAAYGAFGTRPQESGDTAERHKANTKEEDPSGLLNEGFRYRDLETGTFITRDPAGFVDGPNLYAYVRQNPWSKFDPLGLREDSAGYNWKDTDHHKVPVEVASQYWTDSGAKKVLDDAQVRTQGGHNYRAHGRATGYSGHVEAELQQFMKSRKIDSIGGMSAREQRELAEQFVKHIDGTSNKFIRGFNSAAAKGTEAVERWFVAKGQYLPMPNRLGSIDFKAGTLGKRVPYVKWGVGVLSMGLTFQSLRAEGYGVTAAAVGTAVETANPLPFSIDEMHTAVEQGQESFDNWMDQGQANIINNRFSPYITPDTPPALRQHLEEMRDGMKRDPSR
jgi:RHS repeat-associated protein